MKIKINEEKEFQIQVKRLGRKKNPILLIDNILANAQDVREFALEGRYLLATKKYYYPGYICPCTLDGISYFLRWITKYFWKNVYNFDWEYSEADFYTIDAASFFAVFAPRLDSQYINVHVDSMHWLAVIIYLGKKLEAKTSTAFWRHRPTNSESFIQGEKIPLSIQKQIELYFDIKLINKSNDSFNLYQDIYKIDNSITNHFFPAVSHGQWELLDSVEAKFNRLVVYPTWQWHSIAFPNYQPPASLDEARISLNLFIPFPFRENDNTVPVCKLNGLKG
jgi:hypothetical protein